MGRWRQAFSRYRPRVLTLCVLAAAAAALVLANLTDDLSPRRAPKGQFKAEEFEFDVTEPDDGRPGLSLWCLSYGWPLRWRQCVFVPGYGVNIYGRCYSGARLACNAAIWLALLTAATGCCEWLLRRYPLRRFYSLRTALAAAGLIAAACGWYAAARDRAAIQDPLIADVTARNGCVWVRRWGPAWLELLGADPFRRRIVGLLPGANAGGGDDEEPGDRKDRELLERLQRLPDLEFLFFETERLTPALSDALSELRQLETLSIEVDCLTPGAGDALADLGNVRALSFRHTGSCMDDDDESLTHGCLAAIGRMAQLEILHLEGLTISDKDLACLAGLENLKSLSMTDITAAENFDVDVDDLPPLLESLPALPRLETLDLSCSEVDDRNLRYLTDLPRLKSLGLQNASVTVKGLAELAALGSLEELALSDELTTPAALALRGFPRLRTVHLNANSSMGGMGMGDPAILALDDGAELHIAKDDLAAWRRAIELLRQARPGIVIDGDAQGLYWSRNRWNVQSYWFQARRLDQSIIPAACETVPDQFREAVRETIRRWKPPPAAQ